MSGITGSSDGPSYHEYRGVKVVCQSGSVLPGGLISTRDLASTGASIGIPGENAFRCAFCAMEGAMGFGQDRVVGKVLTSLEASITNEVQLKAMKDLIRTMFYQEFNDMTDTAGYAIANSTSLEKLIINKS